MIFGITKKMQLHPVVMYCSAYSYVLSFNFIIVLMSKHKHILKSKLIFSTLLLITFFFLTMGGGKFKNLNFACKYYLP